MEEQTLAVAVAVVLEDHIQVCQPLMQIQLAAEPEVLVLSSSHIHPN
tara:strand:- start:28 stop:168 length:141 start_codon:yes stop_codon:yes gene_type:complete